MEKNGNSHDDWLDIISSVRVFYDPATALDVVNTGTYTPEAGETRAHTYYWVHNIAQLGQPDTTVTADTPGYAVFNNNGARTYVAYNFSSQPIDVHFSDGTTLSAIAPGSYATFNGTVSPTGPTGATGGFQQTVAPLIGGSTVSFITPNPVALVNMHYTVNNGTAHTARMAPSNNGTTWNYTIPALHPGDYIQYSFAYAPSCPITNTTQTFSKTV
jgi:hypothetical protein